MWSGGGSDGQGGGGGGGDGGDAFSENQNNPAPRAGGTVATGRPADQHGHPSPVDGMDMPQRLGNTASKQRLCGAHNQPRARRSHQCTQHTAAPTSPPVGAPQSAVPAGQCSNGDLPAAHSSYSGEGARSSFSVEATGAHDESPSSVQ